MERQKSSVHQAFSTALVVVGAVAICAVGFNYSGKIQVKLGSDGLQLQVEGAK